MAKKPSKATVGLSYPPQYVFSCMVNRYALEREEGFTMAHFGLVNKSASLLDRFTCVFPTHTLETQRENLVQYSDKLGTPKKKIPTWVPPAVNANREFTFPIIDFVHVSHWEDAHAEICFWNYSQGHLADVVKAGVDQDIIPFGVALIRCEIDLQRAFLIDLYDEGV